ncbi:SRPBCC family protein [bacterium]|nr:MAG: SRPBCC family protein [bacterium]
MAEDSTVAYAATILKPRQEVYAFWRDWQNLPRFSRHLKKVEDLGNGRTRWTTEGPQGDVSWEAETTQDVPGERIAWQSVGDAKVANHGIVTFTDAPADRGTEVVVRMAYDMPGGIIGETVAKVTGNSPEAEIAESVRRFKTILECGELPLNEGQPSNQMRGDNQPGDISQKVGLR